jgi:hypothetical protein
VIGPWIAEAQAKKVTAQAEIRTATGSQHSGKLYLASIAEPYLAVSNLLHSRTGLGCLVRSDEVITGRALG